MNHKEDRVLVLLLIGILFFTGTIFVSEHYYPMDGQLFQVLAGMLTSFAGAFFGRMKPKGDDKALASSNGTIGTVNINGDVEPKM